MNKVTEQETSAFLTKQSRARSLKRAEEGLPISPGKKMEVIGSLAKKYKMRIALSKKQGRKYEDLSEEEVTWLKDFLERPEMTYINPGKKDNIYVGKVDGKSVYVQKQHLLWTLRDTLDIINGSEFEGDPNNEASFPGKFEKSFHLQSCIISLRCTSSIYGTKTFLSHHAFTKFARMLAS